MGYAGHFITSTWRNTLVILHFSLTVFHKYKNVGSVNYAEEWPGSRIEFNAIDRKRGFLTKGLWAYSRHPNVACERAPLEFHSFIIHNSSLSNAHIFRIDLALHVTIPDPLEQTHHP